jgi:hypothetical protein
MSQVSSAIAYALNKDCPRLVSVAFSGWLPDPHFLLEAVQQVEGRLIVGVRAHPGTCIFIQSRSKEPGHTLISWVYRGMGVVFDGVIQFLIYELRRNPISTHSGE